MSALALVGIMCSLWPLAPCQNSALTGDEVGLELRTCLPELQAKFPGCPCGIITWRLEQGPVVI